MSGPPYPLPPPPTGIGTGFAIGISPIGTPQPFTYWATVLSQYANSPVLIALIDGFNQFVDQTENLDDFFDLMWNVDTEEGYGLDVWGRIVGVVRQLRVASGRFFGFAEANDPPEIGTFGEAPFYTGGEATSNFALTDDAFRELIFAKALANITDGSIPSLNRLLRNLFPGRGNCWVEDGLDMTMTYRFAFPLTPVEEAIVLQSGVLPRSTGVSSSVVSD